jgi:2-polyprenyl-3-methyl-5-hydroxy-6-metoxy-1,4-benzoquinol methylase
MPSLAHDKSSDRNHASHAKFYEYYAQASLSEPTMQRFRAIRDCVLRTRAKDGPITPPLAVADIGCGAGTQCQMWAELGHEVHGLDINERLVKLAEERAANAGYKIDFRIGSASALPWADTSMDVCLVLELLEHIAEWQRCLDECTRILRPRGILVLTTSNKLCPVQHEFSLPLYSWYPTPLKQYFEQLAVTTHPQLTNFAKYPAVNWFSFYHLRAVLSERGFRCLDRFDVMDLSVKGPVAKMLVSSIRTVPLLRWLGHVATPGTLIIAIKG